MVTATLAATALVLRMRDERAATAVPAEREGVRVQIGFPDGERGMVIAPASEVLREAQNRLGLPEMCAAAAADRKPADGEALDFSIDDGTCNIVRQSPLTGAARLSVGLPLDINEEDGSSLSILPGIGPKKGAAVEAYRRENGRFQSVDELAEVRGIGPKTVERLRSWVVCGGDQSGRAQSEASN